MSLSGISGGKKKEAKGAGKTKIKKTKYQDDTNITVEYKIQYYESNAHFKLLLNYKITTKCHL